MTRVRPAIEADAAALAALSAQLGYPADAVTMAARLRQLAASDADVVLVVDGDDARAVGFAHAVLRRALIAEPFVELFALVVDEAAREGGIGAALLAAVEAWARGRGVGMVRVRSNVLRERAHRFYLRAGYVERKRQAVFAKAL